MKIYSNNIIAAQDEDTRVSDMLSDIKSDFDFIVEGIELISRRDAEGTDLAMKICLSINESLRNHIDEIAADL